MGNRLRRILHMQIKKKRDILYSICLILALSVLLTGCSSEFPWKQEKKSESDLLRTDDFLEKPVTLTLDYLKERLPEDNVSIELSDGVGSVYSFGLTFSRCGENMAVEALLLTSKERRFTNFYLIDGVAYLYRKDTISSEPVEIIYRCPDKTDAKTVNELLEKKKINIIVPIREDYEKIYMFRSNEEEDTISAVVTEPDDSIDTFVIDKETDTIKSVKVMENHNDITWIRVKNIEEITVGELPDNLPEMDLETMTDCISEELLRYTASLNTRKVYDWGMPWEIKPIPGV